VIFSLATIRQNGKDCSPMHHTSVPSDDCHGSSERANPYSMRPNRVFTFVDVLDMPWCRKVRKTPGASSFRMVNPKKKKTCRILLSYRNFYSPTTPPLQAIHLEKFA